MHVEPFSPDIKKPAGQWNADTPSEPPHLTNAKLSAPRIPAAQDIGAITFVQHPLAEQGSLEPNSSVETSQS